jgi:hypothetical protein
MLDPGVDRVGAVASPFVVNATIVPGACDPADCAATLLLQSQVWLVLCGSVLAAWCRFLLCWLQGFSSSGNFRCEARSAQVVTESGTVLPAAACHVTWTCARCTVTSSAAASVTVLTRDPNAWALLLNYSVQTTSYDQQPSRVAGSFASAPGTDVASFSEILERGVA